MAQEYDADIGRALGWDLAYYGWTPKEDAPIDVIEGHIAGKSRFGTTTKRPTRFERKWLQLRQNALRRGRVVHEAVTPKYIEFIDYPTCPVTLVELTHGTGEDTDWSVDRVNNDAAYADGNLIVMSTRANKAKGNKSFLELSGLVADGESLHGLSDRETLRLRCLMEGPCGIGEIGERRNTLWTRICRGSTRTNYHNLQHILLMATNIDSASRNVVFRKLVAVAHADSRQSANLLQVAFEKLKIRLKTAEYPYDACGDVDFQSLLKRWFETIPSSRKTEFAAELESLTGARLISNETVRTWSLDTLGRYSV
ncbi:hypothetical protein [Paraburkholderia sediminicola]|uniref:hypothetical protein n=1 Tax=Paraburkholderia sediminicola TaxID=458836 RepID=UPI0038B96CA6